MWVTTKKTPIYTPFEITRLIIYMKKYLILIGQEQYNYFVILCKKCNFVQL